MPAPRDDIRAFLRGASASILVEVTAAAGSTPRDADAFMLVSEREVFATIGGGQLEYIAIEEARRALRAGAGVCQGKVEAGFPEKTNENEKSDTSVRFRMNRTDSGVKTMSVSLGPQIGQCCGGRVGLSFTAVDPPLARALVARCDREMALRPHVYVFGAGHVGDVLAMALSLAPLRVVLVDTREDELAALSLSRIETRLTAMPEAVARDAPAGSSFVILTHDHALDFLIAAEALKRADAAYVGMIGSKTKRAAFRKWLSRDTDAPGLFEKLVCPIGAAVLKDKRPAVIATLAAAEIMTAALSWPASRSARPARSFAGRLPIDR